MKQVRRIIGLLVVLCLLLTAGGYAGPLEDFEEAHLLYLAAAACTAAYSDRPGEIVFDGLKQEGWELDSYVETSDKADARFILARKIPPGQGKPIYLLALVGTETFKDVKTDLRVDKVYFAGTTPEEFAANASRRDAPAHAPMVHRGFHQYVQAALSAQAKDELDKSNRLLTDLLLEHQDRKVYLVGHSLGGAAATLLGARLLSMGVRPEQIKIITMGAPAVGNSAFRRQFEPVLDVTRVVTNGDPIVQVLQRVVGGYEQFGREVHLKSPARAYFTPHQIATYLDLAIKQYYQKRQQAIEAKVISVPNLCLSDSAKPTVYVAPVKSRLPDVLAGEFPYMREALFDEYRRILPGYVLAERAESAQPLEAAERAGCQWLLMPEVQAYRQKNEVNEYYITLRYTVHHVPDSRVVHIESFASSTRRFTPLQALIHDARTMSRESGSWLKFLTTEGASWSIPPM